MIGHNIKRMREAKGWSQAQLAQKMGYKSKSTINKIEKNINDVNQTNLAKFAEVFKCDPAELVEKAYATPEEYELAWHRMGGGRHPIELSDLEPEIILAFRCAGSGRQESILRLLDIEVKEKNQDVG